MLLIYIRRLVNNFIKDLSDFLFDFTDFLEVNKFISPINKKQISIDYSSNNKQGDLATNFYLIVKRKIINENFNIEKELNDRIKSVSYTHLTLPTTSSV